MNQRRKFSSEFKREAVALAHQPGATLSQIARDIGITGKLLGRWRGQLGQAKSKAFPGLGVPRDEELAAIRRELVRVKQERDFLRDAAAFFAREAS